MKMLCAGIMLGSLVCVAQMFFLALGYMAEGQGLHPGVAVVVSLLALIAGYWAAFQIGDE